MSFHVGQRVVCVDASVRPHTWPRLASTGLTEGQIYVIRGFDESLPDGIVGTLVAGIRHTYADGRPRGFYPDRFRPITERPTDISVFKRLLEPKQLEAAE